METIQIIIAIAGVLLGAGGIISTVKLGKTAYEENKQVVEQYKKYLHPESDGGRELSEKEQAKLIPELMDALEYNMKFYNNVYGIISKVFKKVKK